MGIVFEDDAKPVRATENEFRDVVKFLADHNGTVKSYTVTGGTYEENLAQAAYDKRKMSEAGNELTPARTIRTDNETLDDGKSIKVRLWAVAKIKRQPKPAAAPVATTTPVKAAK